MTEKEEIEAEEFFEIIYETLNREIADIKKRFEKINEIKDEGTFYTAIGRLEEIPAILGHINYLKSLGDLALNYPIKEFYIDEEGPGLVLDTDEDKTKFLKKPSMNMYR